jgi:hypothetical protein
MKKIQGKPKRQNDGDRELSEIALTSLQAITNPEDHIGLASLQRLGNTWRAPPDREVSSPIEVNEIGFIRRPPPPKFASTELEKEITRLRR